MYGLVSIQACATARSIRNATSLFYLSSCLSEPIERLVWRLVTGWTVRGRIPLGARFSAPLQTGRGILREVGLVVASCRTSTSSFLGVKRPELDVNYPFPSRAEVKGV